MTAALPSKLEITPLFIAQDTGITQLFQHFASEPWAMLLDSAKTQRADGRFDIMVAQPVATLSCKGHHCTVTDADKNTICLHKDDPLSLLSEMINQHIPDLSACDAYADLPFKAGAMGLFGYDLGRCYETLPSRALQDCHTPDLAVGIYTWSVVKNRQSNRWYLCRLTDHPCPTPEELLRLVKRPARSTVPFKLTSTWQANMTRDQYQRKVEKIHAYLKAGDCYQVNLAQRFSAGFTGDPWLAYLHLRDVNQAPFSAFLRLPDSHILSISPERFLSVKAGKVESKPIKGTRPRAQVHKQDERLKQALLASEKDKAENLMIVDLLRNDLSKSCLPGSVQVPELFQVESFAAVHHLVSTVTATLPAGADPLVLLKGAFPGGSITGAPKIRAMQIIDELEPHRRNAYCGSIGYLGAAADMDTSICIRTLICEADNIHCWAGGGIVIDSQAEAEYQESLDKVAKILPVLASH